MSADPTRRSLEDAFKRALRGIDLAARVEAALPRRPPRRARVRLLSVGKAAPAMARGALQAWGDRISATLLVLPDGTACDLAAPSLEARRAAHPLPDARSVAAGREALAFAQQGAEDLLLALISGGASALLSVPGPGVTLDDKVAVTQALLASGAPIAEINVVRRHLSAIKGGGLARAASPGRLLTLLASDVLLGGLHDVGSGPTVPDPTTPDDARAALARWAPAFVGLPLGETLAAGSAEARRQRARVVASPADLAEAVARALSVEGFAATVLAASSAPADDLARGYAAMAATLGPGMAVVRAAEPGVTVGPDRPGRGGRAGHVAALVGRRLPEGLVFLAGASDGVDGSSGAAGAVVDASLRAMGIARVEEAIAAFDTAPLHEEAGTSIHTGPTGVNFADVHVLARSA